MSKITAEAEKQKTIDDMASDTLLGSLKLLVKQELAATQKPWQAMSEQEQSDALHRIEMSLRQAATKAIKLISSDNRPSVTATLDQVVFKDGIKAVIKLPKDTASSQFLTDAVSKSVLLVFINPEEHMAGAESVTAEPDQGNLLPGGDRVQH